MVPKAIQLWMLVLMLLMPTIHASAITFEATPNELKANLTESLSMRCSIHSSTRAASTATDVHRVTSIFVTRNDNDDVASLTSYDAPMALADLGNLQVKGSLSDATGEGFLELTWKDPSSVYLGEYHCSIAAVDARGHIVQLTSKLELSAEQPSIVDVIASFNAKFLGQQQTNDILNQKLTSQQQTITNLNQENAGQQQLITNLTTGLHNLMQTNITLENKDHQQQLLTQQTQLDYQQHQLSNQQTLISTISNDITTLKQQNLVQCKSPQVAFTATLPEIGLTTFKGHAVQYSEVKENIGGAYDNSSGQFKCSESGVYLFNVHALGYPGKELSLYIQHNSTPVTYLWAQGITAFGAASASSVLHLQLGDIVEVMEIYGGGLHQGSGYQKGNSFNGVLIHSDRCVTT